MVAGGLKSTPGSLAFKAENLQNPHAQTYLFSKAFKDFKDVADAFFVSTVLLEGFHSFLIPLFRSLPISMFSRMGTTWTG